MVAALYKIVQTFYEIVNDVTISKIVNFARYASSFRTRSTRFSSVIINSSCTLPLSQLDKTWIKRDMRTVQSSLITREVRTITPLKEVTKKILGKETYESPIDSVSRLLNINVNEMGCT